jgi:hypothetical protein
MPTADAAISVYTSKQARRIVSIFRIKVITPALKMEAVRFSEPLASINQSTRRLTSPPKIIRIVTAVKTRNLGSMVSSTGQQKKITILSRRSILRAKW